MGNSESSNPIRNMDKRTARREYRDDFLSSIQLYRNRMLKKNATRQESNNKHDNEWNDGNIKVCIRKRPIFKHEIDGFEFDVITCHNDDRVIVHDARMHADMKKQILNHNEFQFDRVFDEKTTNEQIYFDTVEPLLHIACKGGYSTCMVYGQTGSGKTFTMSSIYEYASNDIFKTLDNTVNRFANILPTISVSFVEIAGEICHDLLNRFNQVQLLTGNDGSVHSYPVVEPIVTSASQLLGMIHHGMNVRTTAATGVHDASSRSHAILRIYIQRNDLNHSDNSSFNNEAGGAELIEGTLTLVDLAGSEHKIDSMYHGKERRKETGNINASLMALKECIRSRAAGKNLSHQYRRSKLTMALKSSFSLPASKTIVIATVSPASKDTEHSLNTLRHACIMNGQSEDEETRFVTGGTVITEVIGEVNLTEIARRNAKVKRTGGTMDVLRTNNGNNITDSKAARYANNELEITEKDRLRIRKAVERLSISKMNLECRELLKQSRTVLGNNKIQVSRLQRRQNTNILSSEENEIEEEEFNFHSSLNNSLKDNVDNNDMNDKNCDDHNYLDNLSIEDKIEAACYDNNQNEEDAMYDDGFEEYIPEIPSPLAANRVSVKQLISSPKIKSDHINKIVNNEQTSNVNNEKKLSDFKKIYDSIYSVAENIPQHILQMQLESILSLHGFTKSEIETLLLVEMQKNKAYGSIKITSSPPHKQNIIQDNLYKNTSDSTNNHVNNIRNNGKLLINNQQRSFTNNQNNKKEVEHQNKLKSSNKLQHPLKKNNSLEITATDKERKKQEGLFEAARQLEEQSALRRNRQEAAKLLREEQDQKRKQLSIQMKSSTPRSSSAGVNNNNKSNVSDMNDMNNSIQYYEQEIENLTNQMENIELSSAAKYAIKKNISLAKAALLRERRSAAQKGYQLQLQQIDNDTSSDHHHRSSSNSNNSAVLKHNSETTLTINEKSPVMMTSRKITQISDHNMKSKYYDDERSLESPLTTSYNNSPRNNQNQYSSSNHSKKITFQEERIPIYNENYKNGSTTTTSSLLLNYKQDHNIVQSPRSNNDFHQIRNNRSHEKPSKLGAASAPFANDYTWQD